jgi:nickel/cobalt exporter
MHQALFYLVSSFWAGVVHAATPGHGKTIAAAYLVGARGRPVDAVILGVFVTLSHVSGIVLVGLLASLGSSWLVPARTEALLGLTMAILVLGLGLWMLWTQRGLIAVAFPPRRLQPDSLSTTAPAHAGAGFDVHHHDHAGHSHADHDVHSAQHEAADTHGSLSTHTHGDHGHGDHHSHSHERHDAHSHDHSETSLHRHGLDAHDHDHGHDDTGEAVWHSHGWGTRHAHRLDLVTGDRPSLAVLMTLSIAGGILPDPAALAILLGALSTGRVVLGLVTVLVFSLGFAATLVVVGVIASQIGRRVLGWLDSVWALRLQLATTLLIISMGAWLTTQAINQFAAAVSI